MISEMRKNKVNLDKFIKDESMPHCDSSSDIKFFRGIEEEFGVEFKPDLYKYIEFYGVRYGLRHGRY